MNIKLRKGFILDLRFINYTKIPLQFIANVEESKSRGNDNDHAFYWY